MRLERKYMLLEKELIYECICGNRKAQKELYEKYSPYFFAVCRRYMRTIEDAEDVLIMSFTTIFASLDTFRGEGSFEAWMKRIVVNTAINELRANRKHYELEEEYNELEENRVSTSENTIYGRINVKYIMEQIQQLPDRKRIIFNLYILEGYSYEKISSTLGINVGTVRSQLAKAREILQEKLKKIR
jgi:RNA polymerase sigma-70 factor (ECF subfamily)